MNEDPQMIMKRRLMEKVLREKQIFSGLLGEALYEMFRNQRRLRDDLYYRLIRGGEINLPELKDRREDIPILFYFIVKTDLTLLMPDGCRNTWEIELPVYEALMDPALEWEGNLRELQTVARQIVVLAVKDFEKLDQRIPINKVLVIRAAHARAVLEKHRGH
jgi:DNA-binding NtrC family response regulator